MNKDYLARTMRHKYLVMKKCAEVGLIRQGVIHDLSKFLPDEFIPYAAHDFTNTHPYYPPDAPFERAVWLHFRRNPHHWNFWIAVKPCRDSWLEKMTIVQSKSPPWKLMEGHNVMLSVLGMPEHYALEMLCDWWAVGAERKPGDKWAMVEWYEKNQGSIILHPLTRDYVETNIGRVARVA